jgi:hypothetical protein
MGTGFNDSRMEASIRPGMPWMPPSITIFITFKHNTHLALTSLVKKRGGEFYASKK